MFIDGTECTMDEFIYHGNYLGGYEFLTDIRDLQYGKMNPGDRLSGFDYFVETPIEYIGLVTFLVLDPLTECNYIAGLDSDFYIDGERQPGSLAGFMNFGGLINTSYAQTTMLNILIHKSSIFTSTYLHIQGTVPVTVLYDKVPVDNYVNYVVQAPLETDISICIDELGFFM